MKKLFIILIIICLLVIVSLSIITGFYEILLDKIGIDFFAMVLSGYTLSICGLIGNVYALVHITM